MKKLRLVSFILSAVMMITALCACGGKSSVESTDFEKSAFMECNGYVLTGDIYNFVIGGSETFEITKPQSMGNGKMLSFSKIMASDEAECTFTGFVFMGPAADLYDIDTSDGTEEIPEPDPVESVKIQLTSIPNGSGVKSTEKGGCSFAYGYRILENESQYPSVINFYAAGKIDSNYCVINVSAHVMGANATNDVLSKYGNDIIAWFENITLEKTADGTGDSGSIVGSNNVKWFTVSDVETGAASLDPMKLDESGIIMDDSAEGKQMEVFGTTVKDGKEFYFNAVLQSVTGDTAFQKEFEAQREIYENTSYEILDSGTISAHGITWNYFICSYGSTMGYIAYASEDEIDYKFDFWMTCLSDSEDFKADCDYFAENAAKWLESVNIK